MKAIKTEREQKMKEHSCKKVNTLTKTKEQQGFGVPTIVDASGYYTTKILKTL